MTSKKRSKGGPERHVARRPAPTDLKAGRRTAMSRQAPRTAKQSNLMFAVIPAVLVIALGIGGFWFASGGGGGPSEPRPADNQTAALLADVVWPPYVTRGSSAVKEAYEFAVVRSDVLEYMPCYCGCGQHNGHRSNKECFIQSMNRGGSTIAFDQHGST